MGISAKGQNTYIYIYMKGTGIQIAVLSNRGREALTKHNIQGKNTK